MKQFIWLAVFIVALWALPAGADCDCGSSSCTGTFATIAAPTAGAGYNITFTFDHTYTCGQYVNGDYWVVVADDEVVINAIDPTLVGTGATLRNGWMVNVDPADSGTANDQYFDGRTGLGADPSLSLPYAAVANDAIVKLASDNPAGVCDNPGVAGADKSCGMHAAVLTVVPTTPTTTSTLFRPPFTGSAVTRAAYPVFRTTDIQEDLILNLDVSGCCGSIITQAQAERRTQPFRLDYTRSPNAENYIPQDAVANSSMWGADIARSDLDALLWLNTNDELIADRRTTLYNFVQQGLDVYGGHANGGSYLRGGGGVGTGKMLLYAFAAELLDNATMQAELAGAVQADFWETDSYYTGTDSAIIWGQRSNSSDAGNEQVYWEDLSAVADSSPCTHNCTGTSDRKSRDPYGYIDGGANPGYDYQSHTAGPTKYTALLMLMIPELQDNWPLTASEILTYADRWVTDGVHSQPDPCAPVDARDAGCTPDSDCTHYKWNCSADPDCTWGPATDITIEASCILDGSTPPEGRYPSSHDTLADTGNRMSDFGDEMWTEFRDDFGSEVCGDGVVEGVEECDDGDTDPGDGCDDNCEVESGWSCDGEDPTSCNRAPVFADDTLAEIAENSANSTVVDTINTATDADSDGLSYSIQSGNPGTTFAVNSSTRQVTVNDNTLLDYETYQQFVLVVRVTDNGTPVLTDDANVTIPIGDVAESTCGDGTVEEAEICDDSNTDRGDGCDSTCEVEKGWTCDGADPTVCAEDPDYTTPANLLHTIRKGGCCPRSDVR